MTLVAEDVVVRLRADMANFEQKMRESPALADRAFAKIIGSSRQMESALKSNSAHAGASIKAMAGSIAGYFTGRELVGLLDSFTRLQNNLRVAGLEGAAMTQVQDRLMASAQKYGVEIEGLSNLFGQLTQASKELGASQEQIFGITDAVSASLKITGMSSQEASGALLQLTQALRGGKVQAEEYNSLLDGLYPLLEAAANGSSRFGGSVAKLTAAVKDGKVSSGEFFAAILAGSDVLEGKAAKSALTLSAGYTTLTNALTVYFGEADKANGISAAMGEALSKIADNLDTLIPAIALIASALGANFVINAMNAANATAALSGGLTMLQRLPVVAAITAIGAAIGYVATESARTEARLSNLTSNFDALSKKVDGATARAIAAGQNIVTVGNASVTAAGKVGQLGRAFQSAAGQAATLAAQAKIATLAMIGTEKAKTKAELDRLESRQRTSGIVGSTFGIAMAPIDYLSGEQGRRAARQERRQGQIDDLRQRLGRLDALERQAVQVDPRSFVEPDKPASAAPVDDGKKSKAKKATGPSAEDIAQQYTQQLRQIVGRDLQSRLAAATSADERAELENRLLNDELRTSQEEIQGNKQFTAAQKKKLLSELAQYESTERARIEQERAEQAAREVAEARENSARYEQDALQAMSRNAETRQQMFETESRILDIMEQEETARLEALIAAGKIADAAKARADLATSQVERREGLRRENESPMERRRREVRRTAKNMSDAVESIQVDAVDRLADGLANASAEYVKLGGVAGDVINGLIRDLVRLAAQQALFGSAGGGGLLGSIGSFLGLGGGGGGGIMPTITPFALPSLPMGFASGGYTGDGPRDKVAGVVHAGEYVIPASAVDRIGVANLSALADGKVAAISSLASAPFAAAPRSTNVTQVLQFDLKGAVMTTELLQQMNNMAAQAATAGGMAGKHLATQDIAMRARRKLPVR